VAKLPFNVRQRRAHKFCRHYCNTPIYQSVPREAVPERKIPVPIHVHDHWCPTYRYPKPTIPLPQSVFPDTRLAISWLTSSQLKPIWLWTSSPFTSSGMSKEVQSSPTTQMTTYPSPRPSSFTSGYASQVSCPALSVPKVYSTSRPGQSVYWQSMFQKSPDPTLVLMCFIWHALYAWDEALESLYQHILFLVRFHDQFRQYLNCLHYALRKRRLS
jgi:hypothetical protein